MSDSLSSTELFAVCAALQRAADLPPAPVHTAVVRAEARIAVLHARDKGLSEAELADAAFDAIAALRLRSSKCAARPSTVSVRGA